jgi:hypothetical protein
MKIEYVILAGILAAAMLAQGAEHHGQKARLRGNTESTSAALIGPAAGGFGPR